MFSQNVIDVISKSSMIRAMFEEAQTLKKEYGAENVYDFSLGNPDPEPPAKVKEVLKRLALEDKPGLHGYMPNPGYPDVRAKLAAHLSKEKGVALEMKHVIITCGASGAMNITLKTLLNPGEEVIIFSPFFVDYPNYIENGGGKCVVVATNKETFQPDLAALEEKITPKTKAIIINTPNNPTGVVYSEEILKDMAALLERKEKEFNSAIFVISDEPYNKIVYDNVKLPSILKIFEKSIVIDSFSKSLSLPGERIGYLAVNPNIKDVDIFLSGVIHFARSYFVSAPALFQRVIGECLEETVDVNIYKERRDVLYNSLIEMGYECIRPEGAFYLFLKCLNEDDIAFKNAALKHRLIVVPGSGFGCPGYVRISYCVGVETIKNSLAAFEALAKEFKK